MFCRPANRKEIFVSSAGLLLLCAVSAFSQRANPPGTHQNRTTFYRDVLPILQQHCQSCHRPGQVGAFPLVSYMDARTYVLAIQASVTAKRMPPWFADPQVGHFSNDPSLSPAEINTLLAWTRSGAPAGEPRDAPALRHWTEGWQISKPDAVVRMPKAVSLPASGDI